MDVGVAFVDADGVFRSCNEVHADAVGLRVQAIIGRPIRDVLPPDLLAVAEPHLRLAFDGQPAAFEHQAGPRWLQFSYQPQATDGRAQGFLVISQDIAASKHTESELRKSEATLRAIFESASQGLVAAGEGGRIGFANHMAESMFGYAAEELLGLPIETLIPARFAERHRHHRQEYFEAPRPRPMGQGLDLMARRKDGSEFPVEISLSHVETAEGRLAIAFVTDVTLRRKVEEERNQFFNLSADLNCVAGEDGFFKQVNNSFQEVLGWSRHQLLASPFIDFVHPDDRQASLAILQGLREGRGAAHFTNRYRCRDGSYRWLSWSAPAPRPGDTLFYAAARDVTGERRLEADRQRLVTLIETSSDAIGLVSPAGRIVYLNAAGLRMSGFTSLDEARQNSLAGLLSPGEVLAALKAEGRWHGEGAICNGATGESVPLDINMFAVGEGDEPVWALVAHDVRRRKRDQEKLQALAAQLLNVQEEERRRIARDLHDDITQKLAMLGIEFGLINRELVQANRAGEERMAGMHERILQISEDVRQISHQLHPSVLEHSGLAPALEAFGRETGKQTGIAVTVTARDVPARIPRAIATGLYRVAQEALRNIAKHASAKSTAITLSGESGLLRLTIIDDGIGFDADAQEGNPGLGMVSMQERVRLLDGVLTVQSEPGEGTRVEVSVRLPE